MIEIYNVKGQIVKTLVNRMMSPGNHTVQWNGNDESGNPVSSGVYYYKMRSGKYSNTKKMLLLK
jgi:flagellar hook assembly protein FlgD